MTDPQEIQGRQGREVTDEEAREISRVEELSYELRISDTMTRDVKTCTPSTRISGLLEILRVRHMSGLPVLENNELIGIISIEDIVHAMEQNDLAAPVSKHMSTRITGLLDLLRVRHMSGMRYWKRKLSILRG